MTRSYEEEITYRGELRRRYFEDPNYRKWSDVVADDEDYSEWRDDVLFIEYISNDPITTISVAYLHKLLENGRELPINWSNFYAYFDERLNDPDNPFRSELTRNGYAYAANPFNKETIEDVLNKYRDILLSPEYDIV